MKFICNFCGFAFETMKIITLNTWGGRAGKEKLLDFFVKQKDSVDIFCLQEIWSAPHYHLEGRLAGGLPIKHENTMPYGKQETSELLSNYQSYFRPHFFDNYGLLTFVKKDFRVITEGEIFVHKYKGFVQEDDLGRHARNIQFVTIENDGKPVTIINFHGLWNGQGKGDSADRLEQSDKIVNFLKELKNPFVFCGDFNLAPETESIKKLENFGLKNLIKEYGVTSTRTSFYTKPEKYADYVFV